MAKVLCVDDNADLVDVLIEMLKASGHEPHCALGGQQCLDMIGPGKCRPDVILLDLMMTPMDGWATLKTIREDAGNDDIPVLILTGKYPTVEEVIEYCKLFEGYLMKPFAIDTLMQEVKDVLEKVGVREEIIRRAAQKGADANMLKEYRKLSSTALVISQFESIITDGTFSRTLFAGMERRLDTIEDRLVEMGVISP